MRRNKSFGSLQRRLDYARDFNKSLLPKRSFKEIVSVGNWFKVSDISEIEEAQKQFKSTPKLLSG
jgi:hypothetical protein